MAINVYGYGEYGETGNVQNQNLSNMVRNVSDNSNRPNAEVVPGQVVEGEIVKADAENVQLRLNNGATLSAQIDSNLELSVGQKLLFQVGMEESSTVLHPLYTNMSNISTGTAALKAAGLERTPTNMLMVSTMMDEGMNVSKQALNSMARSVNSFSNVNPATIVELSKLELPITDANITQYENYKNLEHQIINDVINLSESLTDMIGTNREDVMNAVSNVSAPGINGVDSEERIFTVNRNLMNGNVLHIEGFNDDITNLPDTNPDAVSNPATLATGEVANAAVNEGILPELESEYPLYENININNSLVMSNEILKFVDNGIKNWNDIMKNDINVSNANQTIPVTVAPFTTIETGENLERVNVENVWAVTLNPDEAPNRSLGTEINLKNSFEQSNPDAAMQNNQMDSNSEQLMKNLMEEFRNLSMPAEELNEIANGTMSANDAIDFVKTMINKQLTLGNLSKVQTESLEKLLNNSDFKELVSNQLTKQMLLNPKDVGKDGAVEELYKRLSEQSIRAMDLLNNAGKAGSEAMKSASNINDNVNFMNQLNQMMSYVQLPLRMNEENTHGELYVYSKKKNLTEKDGNVSAFLHLDMDNLGPVDVYVAMQQSKVNTNFYLADAEILDFLETNIHILDKRLTDKGYNMSTSVNIKNKNEPVKSIVTEELKIKNPGTVKTGYVSNMSFDIKA